MRDPYTYPDSTVLINTLNIRDAKTLEQVEAKITYAKMQQSLPHGQWDFAHYKAIHKHLFADLYEWAGTQRTVSIAKGNTLFALPERISPCLEVVFSQLKQDQHLQDLKLDPFIEKSAYYFNELNAIHPFREGNGRTNRVFFSALAHHAGYTLSWAKVNPDLYMQASILGFEQSDEKMQQVFRIITKPSKQLQLHFNHHKNQVNWFDKTFKSEWQTLKHSTHTSIQWAVKFYELGKLKSTDRQKQTINQQISKELIKVAKNLNAMNELRITAPNITKSVTHTFKRELSRTGLER